MLRSARTGEDFKPVAVFLDGYEYHRDKLADDTAKRLAIVQSGRYLQWSLTWNDVNAQFAKSAIQSRNPFVEGLRPRMRGLQEELAGRLGIGDLAKVASQPPLTQLMRYLENPDSRAWTGLAFCRCLGWFDQGAMRGGTVRERFENWFASNGSEEFSQALAALPADRAYGGLAWDREDDPLSVRCVLPLEALGQGGAGPKPDFMGGSVSFDDSRDFEPDVHKAAWQGLLRAWNLLQFLPSFGFFSTRGCAAGVYEPVPWRYAWDVTKPKTAAPPGTVSAVLDAVLEEAVEAVHDGLRRLSESGYRLPSVAYELQDEGGEIVGEAELAWAREKIAGLLADQREFGPMFESSGWRILVLDSENQWVGVVSDLLGGQ
jgi:DEAD/DEAH box helicase domain-containing protein